MSICLDDHMAPIQNQQQPMALYELNGFIEHIGSQLNGGHYMCVNRGWFNDWFLFNDHEVCARTFVNDYFLGVLGSQDQSSWSNETTTIRALLHIVGARKPATSAALSDLAAAAEYCLFPMLILVIFGLFLMINDLIIFQF